VLGRLRISKEYPRAVDKPAQFVLDNAPDNRVLQRVLAMDDHVSEANDLRKIAEFGGGCGIDADQSAHRLADDDEVSLNGIAKEFVVLVFREILAARPTQYSFRGIEDVAQQLWGIMRHRASDATR